MAQSSLEMCFLDNTFRLRECQSGSSFFASHPQGKMVVLPSVKAISYNMEMDFKRVKISTTVPISNADAVREALGKAGAGKIGEYSFCSYSVVGKGRFMPSEDANPHIGEASKLEVIEEEQVEVVCDRGVATQVIVALKKAHPYEEVIIDITPLVDEHQL